MGCSNKQKSDIVEKFSREDKCVALCWWFLAADEHLCPCDAATHTEHLTPPATLCSMGDWDSESRDWWTFVPFFSNKKKLLSNWKSLCWSIWFNIFTLGTHFENSLLHLLQNHWNHSSVLTGLEDTFSNQQKSLALIFEKSNKVLT